MDKTFHIITFGCQMNVADSDWLARALSRAGGGRPRKRTPALFVVNTCSVREKPEQKVYSELGRLAAIGAASPGSWPPWAAAWPSRRPGFFERFPFVRLVFGTDGIAAAPDALDRLAAEPDARVALLDFCPAYPEREDVLHPNAPHPSPAFAPTRASPTPVRPRPL